MRLCGQHDESGQQTRWFSSSVCCCWRKLPGLLRAGFRAGFAPASRRLPARLPAGFAPCFRVASDRPLRPAQLPS